jgi:hypothetical protein
MDWLIKLFDMKASLGGQIVIALGGLVSACILGGLLWKAIYTVIRYIQWINMSIIYVARKTGTPLPQTLIDQYHKLPYNGDSINHLMTDGICDPPESESRDYPLPSRKARPHRGD